MPIYEYKCKDCGIYIERRQNLSDARLRTCESCGGALEKQWSPPAIQFKGEGWYVTDYAGKGSRDKSEKSSAGDSTTTADTASKSKDDSKPTGPEKTGKPE